MAPCTTSSPSQGGMGRVLLVSLSPWPRGTSDKIRSATLKIAHSGRSLSDPCMQSGSPRRWLDRLRIGGRSVNDRSSLYSCDNQKGRRPCHAPPIPLKKDLDRHMICGHEALPEDDTDSSYFLPCPCGYVIVNCGTGVIHEQTTPPVWMDRKWLVINRYSRYMFISATSSWTLSQNKWQICIDTISTCVAPSWVYHIQPCLYSDMLFKLGTNNEHQACYTSINHSVRRL